MASHSKLNPLNWFRKDAPSANGTSVPVADPLPEPIPPIELAEHELVGEIAARDFLLAGTFATVTRKNKVVEERRVLAAQLAALRKAQA